MLAKRANIELRSNISTKQATNFAELNIDYFAKGENSNNWRIARDGCVVVMTNLDYAMKIINLEFK